MTLWNAVLVASIVCVALKTLGYLIPPHWLEAPRPARIADLLTVALLAALVAVQTLGAGQAIVVDARVPAVLVAAGLLLPARAVPRRGRWPPRSSPRCCACWGWARLRGGDRDRLAGCAPGGSPESARGSWPSSSAPCTRSPGRSRTPTCSAGSRSASCSRSSGARLCWSPCALLTSDRWATLATGLGMIRRRSCSPGRGPGGSVIVPADAAGDGVDHRRADPRRRSWSRGPTCPHRVARRSDRAHTADAGSERRLIP